jgi:hypothetical protein
MPNDFSIEIHAYLTRKIAEAERALASKDKRSSYYRGQLEELFWLRRYLKENIDLKDFIYYQ